MPFAGNYAPELAPRLAVVFASMTLTLAPPISKARNVVTMPERRLLDNPKHWRDGEEETRTLTDGMQFPETKARLLKIADEYARLAEESERPLQAKDKAAKG